MTYIVLDIMYLLGSLILQEITLAIWAMSWENLLMPYANNKGAD